MQPQQQPPPPSYTSQAMPRNQDRPVKLGELNHLIKNYVEQLNHALRLAARVVEVEAHLIELESVKVAYIQHLNTLIAIRKDSKEWYTKLFNDRTRLNNNLMSTYNELKEQWDKGVERSNWVIRFPFEHSLPRLDEPTKKSFVKAVKTCCTRGYTSAFGRYHYVPKVSYRSATLKMKELKFQLDNNSPSVSELQSKLDTLDQQENSLNEAIANIKTQIQNAQGPTDAQLTFRKKAMEFFTKKIELGSGSCSAFDSESSTLDLPVDSIRVGSVSQNQWDHGEIPQNHDIFASQCPLDLLVDSTTTMFEPVSLEAAAAASLEPALSEPTSLDVNSFEPASSQQGSVIVHKKSGKGGDLNLILEQLSKS